MTTTTQTIADFLLARLAEDEAVALEAGAEWWMASVVPGPSTRKRADEPTKTVIDSPACLITYEVCRAEFAEHIVRHDPARVLADVEAKRRIVEGATRPGDPHGEAVMQFVLTMLAQPYRDHPDWRAEWNL